MDKISEYLEKYQDLWTHMNDYNCFCMDIAMNIIDESDYYGVDFSGNKKVVQIFFCGQSDNFQCIWIGNHAKNILDQLPIYEMDLSPADEKFESKGNFKTYMTTMLNDFLDEYENQLVLDSHPDSHPWAWTQPFGVGNLPNPHSK